MSSIPTFVNTFTNNTLPDDTPNLPSSTSNIQLLLNQLLPTFPFFLVHLLPSDSLTKLELHLHICKIIFGPVFIHLSIKHIPYPNIFLIIMYLTPIFILFCLFMPTMSPNPMLRLASLNVGSKLCKLSSLHLKILEPGNWFTYLIMSNL